MSEPDYRRNLSEVRGDSDHQIAEDLELVVRLVRRDAAAWRKFIEQYSTLLYGVTRRKLFAEDEDEVRTVYVDILYTLYHGKIAEYEGRSPLSAWLVVLARGAAVDFLRRRDGRDQRPAAYEALSEPEKCAFRLRHVEGLSLDVVGHVLREQGHTLSRDELVDALERIEDAIGPRYLTSLEYQRKASASGIDSGRLLRYMTAQATGTDTTRTPMDDLVEKEDAMRFRAASTLLLARLTRAERLVLRLRYQRNWQAERIARIMKLPGATSVYQITRRATRKLARVAQGEDKRT